MLNERTFDSVPAPSTRAGAPAGTMTLGGTIGKSLVLLVVAGIFSGFGWNYALDWFSQSGLWWLLGYFILIGLTIGAVSNPELAMPVGLLYSVVMGFWMGAVSRMYEEVYDGIVSQALLASVCAFLACLLLYLVGAVRLTPKLTRTIITATLAIALMYFVAWILSIFGVDLLLLTEPTTGGILLSVGICIVAALNLFLDFGFIESGIQRSAPVTMEWYAAFGLISTLVWLYAEILRLLALLRSRQ
jgi:uncharacterized YccA/Bax inhibitor family protein